MFDAERVLGSVLGSSAAGGLTGKKSRKKLKKIAKPQNLLLAAGLAGAAYFAHKKLVEHQERNAAPSVPPRALPDHNPATPGHSAGPAALPPVPTDPRPAASPASLPPPPPLHAGGVEHAPPPPMEPPAGKAEDAQADALLLLRAMIAAANADHHIDAEERNAIMNKAGLLELTEEERGELAEEFDRPLSLKALTREVKSPEMAERVYAVALLAIEVDTDEERRWLDRLAEMLNLSPEKKNELEADWL